MNGGDHHPEPTSASASVAVSVDGRIAEDKLCVDCGYNLRSLKTDGRCPECGVEVAASLVGHELHAASLPWLRTVRRGFVQLRAAIVLALLVGLLVILPQALLATLGFVRATTVEPRVAYRGEGYWPRHWARVLALTALLLWLALELHKTVLLKSSWSDYVVIYVPLVLAVLAPLAVAAFVQHLIALLERTAEEKRLKSARRVRGYVHFAIVLAAIVLLVDATAPLYRSKAAIAEPADAIGGAARGCAPCITLILAFGALRLVWGMATIMDDTLARAEHARRSARVITAEAQE
jgi:hypothetical protein